MAGETFIGKPWRQPYTAQQLQDAATHQVPIVGSNGNWWRWDIDTSDWVDTGVTVATSLSDSSVTWPKLAPEARKSNRNLLDNAYFIGGGSQQGGGQFPVNQRRLTEWTDAGYTIDRWKLNISTGGSGSVALNSDGITLTCVSGSLAFRQALESLPADTYTASVLTTTHGLISGTLIWDGHTTASTPEVNGVYLRLQMYSGYPHFTVQVGSGVSVKLQAAKLELGPNQTLAYESVGGVDLK